MPARPGPAVCAPRDTFAKAFEVFTHGIFRKFPWSEFGAVVAGGGVSSPPSGPSERPIL